MSILNRPIQHQAFDPNRYVLRDELRQAVEVALALQQPLLLTGEPGTGKTQLAWKIAHELSLPQGSRFQSTPLVFNTKTTSTARDLFYTYDAVSHFQAANIQRPEGSAMPGTAQFIELQALGQAIARTQPGAVDQSLIATQLPKEPVSSVVLIDEIDKAPRDFTNDILNEIVDYSFYIREQANYPIRRSQGDEQIVVVMTSNSEKNLPDAFLRRCVFYHIPFPEPKLMLDIVQKQLGGGSQYTEEALEELVKAFNQLRDEAPRKKPATAELIAWLRMMELQGYMEKNKEGQQQLMLQNLSVLVKTQEDYKAVSDFIQQSL